MRSSRLAIGSKTADFVLQKIFVTKSEEVETRSNLAEFSKEDYVSKRAVLPTMMSMRVLIAQT
jgi:hypothetical protein